MLEVVRIVDAVGTARTVVAVVGAVGTVVAVPVPDVVIAVAVESCCYTVVVHEDILVLVLVCGKRVVRRQRQ